MELKQINLPDPDPGTLKALWNQAKSIYSLARYSEAYVLFESLEEHSYRHQRNEERTEALVHMIRILIEQERKEELSRVTEKLQGLLVEKTLSAKARAKVHYSLGVLSHSLPQGYQKAREHFENCIAVSLSAKDFETLAYGLYGKANISYELDEPAACLAELEKLDQILNFHPNSDLKTTALLLRAFLYRYQGKPLEALPFLHAACEQLRAHPQIYLFLLSLYGLGSTYLKMADYSSAQLYLELAKSSCSPDELPRLYKLLIKTLNKCRTEAGLQLKNSVSFDLSSGTVERKGMGSISLQSQFILRDLLTLFFQNPGRVFSKEELVEKVWKEDYSPLIHDNKIYVTLKRLRLVLEPLFPDTEAILRSRNGYLFNQQLITHLIQGATNHEA